MPLDPRDTIHPITVQKLPQTYHQPIGSSLTRGRSKRTPSKGSSGFFMVLAVRVNKRKRKHGKTHC